MRHFRNFRTRLRWMKAYHPQSQFETRLVFSNNWNEDSALRLGSYPRLPLIPRCDELRYLSKADRAQL